MNKRKNDIMTANAIARLERKVAKIAVSDFPAALQRVGTLIIEETKRRHEYRNRTGALERSHDSIVVKPGESVTVEIDMKDAPQAMTLSSEPNKVTLYLLTHKQYGLFVEVNHGLAVLIQGFLKLRRNFIPIFKSAFTSRRIT